MSDNGHLPNSVLAPIYDASHQVVGWLRTAAAMSWNAMCDEARRRGWPVPLPDGPDSTYRNYDRQVFWRRWWCGKGNCSNAAVPGTSNHGEGIAVDCSHKDPSRNRWVVDRIGAKYGWEAKGSDAPWEEWHMKWQVGWFKAMAYRWLPLYYRSRRNAIHSGYIMILTGRLKSCGYLKSRTSKYTPEVTAAVKRFQTKHFLLSDGITGAYTWEAVRLQSKWCVANKKHDV